MALKCSTENHYRRNAIYGHYKPHFWYVHGQWKLAGIYGDSERAFNNSDKLSIPQIQDLFIFHNKLKGKLT